MVVLAQLGGLVLLVIAILITVFVGSICGIAAIAKIGALRDAVARLETSLRLLKERIGAAEASLRKLSRGRVSGPTPADEPKATVPSRRGEDVRTIEERIEAEAAAPKIEAPPRPLGQAGPSKEPDLRPEPEAAAPKIETPPRPLGQAGPSKEPDLRTGPFVASRALRIVHAPGCTHAKRISKKNRQKFDTLDAAFAAGKDLCPKCLPPVKPEAEAPPPEKLTAAEAAAILDLPPDEAAAFVAGHGPEAKVPLIETATLEAGKVPASPPSGPKTPSRAALLKDIASPAPPKAEAIEEAEAIEKPKEPKPSPLREAIDELRPAVPHLAPKKPRDQEWWKWFEETVGKRWITWVGALILIVAAGLGVKYAYDEKMLKPWMIVVFGVLVGLGLNAVGVYLIRRGMRALGQGLIGTGLAVLYVSLFSAYIPFKLLPQPAVFLLMALVTAGGVALAVVHDALPISFLAVLGGLLTPVMLREGTPVRDVLFAYLLILDIGVLAVAFFKNWRALDVLAFVGTWAYFSGWWLECYGPSAVRPTMAWLAAFYVIFLVQPFVYHLRASRPIAGERFFMAVSNAAGMFGWAYAILAPKLPDYKGHPYVLGLVTLAMAGSYLALGAVTRKRVRDDVRAVFAFIALSVMFLTITIPILLGLHGMTVAWALEAPVLVYLACKYRYFPVRLGALVPLALAGRRAMMLFWSRSPGSFRPVFNRDFGTAILVAVAGWAYAVIQHRNRKEGIAADRFFKIVTGIAAGFFALVVLHMEVWQCLGTADGADPRRWAAAFVWAAGAVGFLAGGMVFRSIHARASGLVALLVALVLMTWDYGSGTHVGRRMFLDGRFLAGLAGVLVVLIYASVYRRSKKVCLPGEKCLSDFLHGAGILLMAVLVSFETWQWFALRERLSLDGGSLCAARAVLVFVWAAAWAAYLASGVRRRSIGLRGAGLVALAVSAIAAVVGYWLWRGSRPGGAIYVNWLFLASATVPLGAFAHGFVLRRLKDVGEPEEKKAFLVLYGTAIFLSAVLASVETWLWLDSYGLRHVGHAALVLIWIAGSAAYLASGVRLRSIELRVAGLVALTASAIIATVGYSYWSHEVGVIYVNWLFLASATVPLGAFGYGFVLRRLKDVRKPDEGKVLLVLYGLGIFLAAILASVETWLWLDSYGLRHVGRAALVLIWVAGSAAYLASGVRLRSIELRVVGLVALTASAIIAAAGYGYPYPEGGVSYLNWRFVAAVAVGIMAFLYAYVLRQESEALKPQEKRTSREVHGVAIMALLVLVSWETSRWLGRAGDGYPARCLLPVIWSVGCLSYLGSGIRLRSLRLRSTGLFALAVAAVFAGWGYRYPITGLTLYLNGRFFVAFVVVLTTLVHARVLRNFGKSRGLEDTGLAGPLLVIVTAALFLLLSVETYLHFIRAIAHAESARKVAQMALSIVWGVYASGVLAVGFWRKARPLRLAALGLFFVTAAKVALVDLRRVSGGYRIVSFLVLGLLMIGASYLYHRVEKWLEPAEDAGGKEKAGAAEPEDKKR